MPKIKFMHQVILTAVIAALLLFVANTAIWANRAIFDTNTFTTTAVTSLTSESSRQALAQEVVDRALADKPTIKSVIGGTATKLVSGLLGTSQFNAVLEKAVGKLQVYMTSNNQKSISLDLSGVKNTVEKLLTVADSRGANTENASERVSALPDELVLLNAENVPSFYNYGLVFLWMGPLCAVGALALLAYPYLRDRRQYYKVALIQGSALVVAGLLCLLVGPLVRPPVLANINSPNMRVVVGNLYDSFVAIFNQQAYWLIVAGVLLALVPLAVRYGLKLAAKRTAKSAVTVSKPKTVDKTKAATRKKK
jgi:hypothetical protein